MHHTQHIILSWTIFLGQIRIVSKTELWFCLRLSIFREKRHICYKLSIKSSITFAITMHVIKKY